MKNFNNTLQTLVLGGKGKTGRRVVNRLRQLQVPVRIGSRSATPAFDWTDMDTWVPVVEGMDAVYITFQPDLAVPGAREAIRAFTQLAVQSGVQKLVLLSGRGEEEAQLCESIVMESGISWTIVRCSWFCQNFSESFLLEPILTGQVVLPVGDTGEPFVDAEDIADVVVAALTEQEHSQKIYELTGPRLISFQQAVHEIAQATGREISFSTVNAEQFAEELRKAQATEDDIAFINYLFTEVLDGRNEQLADGVQQALGRVPKDFSQYVYETAASGIWNA